MDDMLDSFAQTWLNHQCKIIPNVSQGMTAFNVTEGTPLEATASWPAGHTASADLLAAAGLALSRQAPVVSAKQPGESDTATENLIIACPLQHKGKAYGVVSIQVIAATGQQAAVIQLLQWGAAWLDLLLSRETSLPLAAEGSSLISDSLAAALTCEHTEAAASSVATLLAQQLRCERVSIGLITDERLKISAVSQSTHFDVRSNLVRHIEACMEEALDQTATIVYPVENSNDELITTAHLKLSEREHNEGIYSIPLIDHEHQVGAICFELANEQTFDEVTVSQCEQIARLLAPILHMKQLQDRPTLAKIKDDVITEPAKRLLGPKSLRWKVSAILLATVFLILSACNGEFRISAPAKLEGTVQRAVVAPFKAYIANANVRAGETVKSGTVLAELDGRELELEKVKWRGQREEFMKKYNGALAKLDHAEARIFRTQAAQAEAQLAILDDQLARTRLLAPFDGVIIAGDLSQSLGSPVERGEVLFEIAPLNEYRVVLQIDGRDISEISVGQPGYLTLSAIPGKRFPLQVEKITSVYMEENDNAAFRVEASLTETELSGSLRPGMQGIGKVVAGENKYIWIMSRRLVGWLQLRLWEWLP